MKDGETLAIYVSSEKTYVNADIYTRDHQEAEKIKAIMDKMIITK